MSYEPMQPSDERLNALIDGELTGAEAEALLDQMRRDPGLRDRMSQFRLVKDLVRHAYVGVEAPEPDGASVTGNPWWRFAAAACMALGVGLWAGWTAREASLGARVPSTPVLSTPMPSTLAESGLHKLGLSRDHIVLHLSSSQVDTARLAIDRVESILASSTASDRPVAVELVVNGNGIDLLRDGVSSQAARIAALRASYPGLSLVACGQTAQRLRDNGAVIRYLPGTVEASSALDAVMKRLQQGWAYIAI